MSYFSTLNDCACPATAVTTHTAATAPAQRRNVVISGLFMSGSLPQRRHPRPTELSIGSRFRGPGTRGAHLCAHGNGRNVLPAAAFGSTASELKSAGA